ncbi:Peroxin/Dysferlin domain-containing protein [Gautieria morchelliformis]|nr:Peroxin/Dysferlin domain-containing protein [Gautieria morchelliformis]
MSRTSTAPVSAQGPNLIQFIESVPPSITLLLVDLAPVLSWLRWAAEVVSWKSHWTDPWLTIAVWWALCLSSNVILRFLLPLTLLLPAMLPYLPFRRAASHTLPTTESSIATSLSDITTLRTLLPALPVLPPVPLVTALRVSSVLYIPYVLATYFVPMPILLGIAGTLVITYRAPWACTLRTVLGRSAYVQRCLLYVWSIVSGSEDSLLHHLKAGSPTTSRIGRKRTAFSSHASPPIRFNFTILECQRWWMGLDWTAALLPGERPSWCSVSHQPVPPPSAFSLPPPTSVFLPAPNGKRVKRTATWRWEDGEWGLLINSDGAGVKRVEKKPPGLEEEEGGSRIARAANMLKERTATMGSASEASAGKDDKEATCATGTGTEQELGEELRTDTDGWIYGDNKWEAASAKGGLGKYTRYRRWTRIAVLEETVEDTGPGELGTFNHTVDQTKPAHKKKLAEEHPLPDGQEKSDTRASGSPTKEHGGHSAPPLRERLKSAVKRV